MKLLYNPGIHLYYLLIKIAALFNSKAQLFISGREGWYETLQQKINPNSRYLWFHCASLGEFEQGRPLIEHIKKEFPQFEIILTFFSPSGYEVRKNYSQADIVIYLPIDSQRNARKFISLIKPEKAFFIKYEYWYNYIEELKKNTIPLYIVSAIFRKDQLFFRRGPLGSWYREMICKAEHLFVQNEESARLLQSININHYTVTGDTRFDRVAEIAKGSIEIPFVNKFKRDKVLLVAGSTWKPDEELLISFINNRPDIKMIIAPHEVDEININRVEKSIKNLSVRLSKVDENSKTDYQVLIIDSIGVLSSLYQYGDIAYIGGGFGVGIHNILEAATFGLPVVFGPNHQKFQEAVELKNLGGAFSIGNFVELEKIFNTLIENRNMLAESSKICKDYINKNVGATDTIISKVFNRE